MKTRPTSFHRLCFSFAGLFLLLGLAACGGSSEAPAADKKPFVVATTTMVADLVRAVGGERVRVHGLMAPGVDPHLYKPTARDVADLRRADAVFYNGLFLEGRMTDALVNRAREGGAVWAVAEAVPEEDRLEPPEFEGHYDPHVWFDGQLWALTVDVVVEGLSQIDPEGAEAYARGGQQAKEEILALDAWTRERLAAIPPERRVLITSHDAYNYFGRAYGFEVVGVQGISTAGEAGLADIARMVDFIRERGIPAIFVESSVAPNAIERISEDAGVAVGGELFSDATGPAGEMETVNGETYDVGTYVGMVKHNVNAMVAALMTEDE